MYSVYVIKSVALGQLYVGLTKNLRQRMAGHRHRHPEWFVAGFKVAVISHHRTLLAGLRAEARSMVALKTLSPNGLNRAVAGGCGRFASLLTPSQRKELSPKKTQEGKDAVAIAKLASGPKISPNKKTEWLRRSRAWRRKKAGLPPLPGTEHLLDGPERLPLKRPTAATRKQMSASRKKWLLSHQHDAKVQAHLKNWKGKKRTAEDRTNKAEACVKKYILQRVKLTWPQICKAVEKAQKRKAQGDAPVAGTEWTLSITKKPKVHCMDWIKNGRDYRRWAVAFVHEWRMKYAKDQGWVDR